jgi:hypothetical protein
MTTRNTTPDQLALLLAGIPPRFELLLGVVILQGQGTTDPIGLRAAMRDAIESGRVPPSASAAEVSPQAHAPQQRDSAAQRVMGEAA